MTRYWNEAWSLIEDCSHASSACDHCWSESATTMRRCQSNRAIRARYRGLTDGGRVPMTVPRWMQQEVKVANG